MRRAQVCPGCRSVDARAPRSRPAQSLGARCGPWVSMRLNKAKKGPSRPGTQASKPSTTFPRLYLPPRAPTRLTVALAGRRCGTSSGSRPCACPRVSRATARPYGDPSVNAGVPPGAAPPDRASPDVADGSGFFRGGNGAYAMSPKYLPSPDARLTHTFAEPRNVSTPLSPSHRGSNMSRSTSSSSDERACCIASLAVARAWIRCSVGRSPVIIDTCDGKVQAAGATARSNVVRVRREPLCVECPRSQIGPQRQLAANQGSR